MLLHEKLQNRKLILASQSPRRRELMTGSGLPYTLAPKYPCEESYPADLPVDEVPLYLSRLKSEAWPNQLQEGEILLTADTVVIAGEPRLVLGKPANREEAIAMLHQLSGARHTVITGVTLRDQHRTHTFGARSEVWFRKLSNKEIEYYIDNYAPYDKAGSYGVQEWIGYVAIERIDGSFYNVMGLPIQRVYSELQSFIE